MTGKFYNVLFLCTGNFSRSIFGERLINRPGRGKLQGLAPAAILRLDLPTVTDDKPFSGDCEL